ncbi:hypothetical protein [Ferruginibacter sp.]|nr:hypothetical protein [Ferruginibacter sp.]
MYIETIKVPAFLIISVLFTACNNNKGEATDVLKKLYSTDSIAIQSFILNNDRDTTLKGSLGTTLRIYKNTFTDSIGQPVKGQINLEFKEVFSPVDFVLGNLTTTSNGQQLESSGMVYLNATINNKQLNIAEDKVIGVIVPRDNQDDKMQVYEGNKDSLGINWINPRPILNEQIKRKEFEQISITWVRPENSLVSEMPLIGDTLFDKYKNVQNDTIVLVNGRKVQMYKPVKIKFTIDTSKGNDLRFIQEVLSAKGTNMFIEDYNTNYIFSIKKLGWANIDKLYDDPRTKEVELITSIENHSDFNTVYVSLIISNKKMYIPGYKKMDNSYSFTHNDQEKLSLPVGETATILATGYKGDKPYFAIKKIRISEKQIISFKLLETTMEQLKVQLKKEI